ncbi:hypothetical protein [Gibbsiella quercinecans]|uniref:hypothetical protein n=1 Tax=Gibbsiella quercinecans TaxID=929813 RepID=UPI002431CF63|nr:hypothetical protein [Gibbsiella quercinecans]
MSKKATLMFPSMLVVAREQAQLYLKTNRAMTKMIAELYFRAAYGLESISFYEKVYSSIEVEPYDNFTRS